jgi:hypothetical protein
MGITLGYRHLAPLAVLVGLALAAPAQAESSSAQGSFAGKVEVDGRALYLQCKGAGAPTVVLISGYRNDGEIWTTPPGPGMTPVFDGVAVLTRVCAYDHVLSRGKPVALPPNAPAAFDASAFKAAWVKGQDKLTELVPNSRRAVAEGSDRYIQIEQPNLVIQAVRQVVNAVRDPRSWKPATP